MIKKINLVSSQSIKIDSSQATISLLRQTIRDNQTQYEKNIDILNARSEQTIAALNLTKARSDQTIAETIARSDQTISALNQTIVISSQMIDLINKN